MTGVDENKYKVSVILPCYNVARYIDRAAASIVAQTFSDYEVIFINDGSTDDTLAAIEPYCAGKPNWTVYSYDNGGVSAARNRGIDKARGEYLYFCDPDDSMEPTLLEKCVERLERDNSDAVHFLYKSINSGDGKEKKVNGGGDRRFVKSCYRGGVIDEFLPRFVGYSDEDLNDYGTAEFGANREVQTVWRFVFRRSVIVGNDVRYLPGVSYAEDILFVVTFLCYAQSVSVIEERLYSHYEGRGDGLIGLFATKGPEAMLEAKVRIALEKQKIRERCQAARGVDIFSKYAGSQVMSAFELMLMCGGLGLRKGWTAAKRYLDLPSTAEAFRLVTVSGKPWRLRVPLLLVKCRLAPLVYLGLWGADRIKRIR